MDPSASPPATRSPSSRMRARGRATSSRSPRSSGPASSTGSACASRPSRSSGGSRRSREPGGAREAEVRQVTVDFQTLGAESSFPGLEDKIATLAARVRRGEEPDDEQTLTRSLWSLSLGELVFFQRYLALSSRLVELEAAHAELEAARLDLWLRRLTLDLTAEPGAEPLEQAAPPPFTCARYPVGRVEFVSCREPVRP